VSDWVPGSHSSQKRGREASALGMLSALLTEAGIDGNSLATALDAIAIAKDTPLKENEELTFFTEKTLIYEDQEAFIYRRGDSKSGRFYFRIYDEKHKKPIFRSLKTTDKTKALAAARILFIEMKGKIERGEKIKCLTTNELLAVYAKNIESVISEIPRQGITPENARLKRYFLKNWQEFIITKGFGSTPIDRIPPEKTREFGKELLAKPKKNGTTRSRELINNNITEVMRMYKTVAIREKYISSEFIPQIDRLTIQPDESYKRDILTEEQFERYWNYLHFNYTREKTAKEEEILKRKIFQHFIGLLYQTGMRPKELLGLKLKEISNNPKWNNTQQKTLVILKVRKENSKTGKGRIAVAPVKEKIKAIISAYKSLGFEHEPEDYIFCNYLSKGRNAYTRQNYYQRLKDTLEQSGLQQELNKEGKSITLYSGRHSYACWRLRHGDVPIYLLAKQMGTSIQKIESTYGHIEVETQAEVITRAQDHIRRTGIILESDLGITFCEEE
jgi:integrase